MNNVNNNSINIMAQAFYGNRTETEINKENIDRFILGYQDNSLEVTEPIDRTIIRIPNTDIVLVYNKYNEENSREMKERAMKESNYIVKPLAIIPEENIELYSRCIACRMNAHGELESLQDGDFNKLIHYLAE